MATEKKLKINRAGQGEILRIPTHGRHSCSALFYLGDSMKTYREREKEWKRKIRAERKFKDRNARLIHNTPLESRLWANSNAVYRGDR